MDDYCTSGRKMRVRQALLPKTRLWPMKLSPVETLKTLRLWIYPRTNLQGWGLYNVNLGVLRKRADIQDSSEFLPFAGSSLSKKTYLVFT